MVADKKHAVTQATAIYGSLFLLALIMSAITKSIGYLIVLPGLFGSIVCYLQGIFNLSVWRESNYVSTQRRSVQ